MENWRIEIQERPQMFYTDIFIFRKTSDGKMAFFVPKENDVVEERVVDIGAVWNPTLTIPTDLLPIFMEAFKRKGIKMPEESFTKGKLEATENHLKDLRTLLKLK